MGTHRWLRRSAPAAAESMKDRSPRALGRMMWKLTSLLSAASTASSVAILPSARHSSSTLSSWAITSWTAPAKMVMNRIKVSNFLFIEPPLRKEKTTQELNHTERLSSLHKPAYNFCRRLCGINIKIISLRIVCKKLPIKFCVFCPYIGYS